MNSTGESRLARGRPPIHRRVLIRALIGAEGTVAMLIVLPCLFVVATFERRRPHRPSPRVWWGAEPLINNKYHSRAVRAKGYESETVVTQLYHNTKRSDFDYVASELMAARPLLRWLHPRLRRRLEPYWLFGWSVRRFDVFVYYASTLMMRRTWLRRWELRILGLAGKKVVLIPYGADVQLNSRMRGLLFKHAYAQDYPGYVRQEARVREELYHASKYADYVLSGCDWVDHMPWWDGLTAGHFSIDTEEWKPSVSWAPRPAGSPVTVLHAPNHREIKGTRFLLAAIEELQAEGVPIELQVLEGVPNDQVKQAMESADVVADQFIVGWYAMFAIEAMALGKPVMCYLRPDLRELYEVYSFAGECPIVDTHPGRIKEVLRDLAADPGRREELGAHGRVYVERHHSLESAGGMFDEIFRRVWP